MPIGRVVLIRRSASSEPDTESGPWELSRRNAAEQGVALSIAFTGPNSCTAQQVISEPYHYIQTLNVCTIFSDSTQLCRLDGRRHTFRVLDAGQVQLEEEDFLYRVMELCPSQKGRSAPVHRGQAAAAVETLIGVLTALCVARELLHK